MAEFGPRATCRVPRTCHLHQRPPGRLIPRPAPRY